MSKIFNDQNQFTIEDTIENSGVDKTVGFEWKYLNRGPTFETAKIFVPSTIKKFIFETLKANFIKFRTWYNSRKSSSSAANQFFKKRIFVPLGHAISTSEVLMLKNTISNKLLKISNNSFEVLKLEHRPLKNGLQIVITFKYFDDHALSYLYNLQMEDLATKEITRTYCLKWWRRNDFKIRKTTAKD